MTKIERADASIAEGLRRLGAGGAGGTRVCDVLPKCGQCQLTVLFNGCGACGMLFDAMRWDELPVWDDGARDRLEMVTRGRHAARLLAAQANSPVSQIKIWLEFSFFSTALFFSLSMAFFQRLVSTALNGSLRCGARRRHSNTNSRRCPCSSKRPAPWQPRLSARPRPRLFRQQRCNGFDRRLIWGLQ